MNELQIILQKICTIDQKQDEMLGDLRELKVHHEDQVKRVTDVEKTLYGDGQPGLKEKVQSIEEGCKTRHAPRIGGAILQGVAQIVIAGVILAVLGFAMGLWKNKANAIEPCPPSKTSQTPSSPN
jgi:hypothetical protein